MSVGNAIWHDFPDRQTLAHRLARDTARQLQQAVGQRGQAILVVSGGTTPGAFFAAVSSQEIPWEKVTVTLADERLVPPDHPRSNERLVREKLLRSNAARAMFLPLYSPEPDVREAARQAGERISLLAGPFDVVILGMGLDGHCASIFPDAENLAELIAPDTPQPVLPVRSQSAGETRMSLTLAWMLRASHIVLHVEGQQKRSLLEACLAGRLEPKPPIAALFAQAERPVRIYWAPAGEGS